MNKEYSQKLKSKSKTYLVAAFISFILLIAFTTSSLYNSFSDKNQQETAQISSNSLENHLTNSQKTIPLSELSQRELQEEYMKSIHDTIQGNTDNTYFHKVREEMDRRGLIEIPEEADEGNKEVTLDEEVKIGDTDNKGLIKGIQDMHPDVFRSIVQTSNGINGLAISNDGYIITTNSAISEKYDRAQNNITLIVSRDSEELHSRKLQDTQLYYAGIVARNKELNLALLKIEFEKTDKGDLAPLDSDKGFYYREIEDNRDNIYKNGDKLGTLFLTGADVGSVDGVQQPLSAFKFAMGEFDEYKGENDYTVDFYTNTDERQHFSLKTTQTQSGYVFTEEGAFAGIFSNKVDEQENVHIIQPDVIYKFIEDSGVTLY